MDPLIISLLVGVLVLGMVLAVAFALAGRQDDIKAGERLDLLVGRRNAKDSSADMLLKQARSTRLTRRTYSTSSRRSSSTSAR